MGKGWGVVIACAALCATLWTAPAEAAFPGQNGKIAFARDGDIWTVNPDGTGRIRITTNPARDFSPRWSPDGKQIASGRCAMSQIPAHAQAPAVMRCT